MGLNWPDNNHNYVPAYQMSGIPFVTGSVSATELTTTPLKVKFPYVTRWIQIRNTGNQILRVGFTENGVNANNAGAYHITASNRNYIGLRAGNSIVSDLGPIEVKCTEVWLRSDSGTTGYELTAGYTAVPTHQFLTLTGSENFQGVG